MGSLSCRAQGRTGSNPSERSKGVQHSPAGSIQPHSASLLPWDQHSQGASGERHPKGRMGSALPLTWVAERFFPTMGLANL